MTDKVPSLLWRGANSPHCRNVAAALGSGIQYQRFHKCGMMYKVSPRSPIAMMTLLRRGMYVLYALLGSSVVKTARCENFR